MNTVDMEIFKEKSLFDSWLWRPKSGVLAASRQLLKGGHHLASQRSVSLWALPLSSEGHSCHSGTHTPDLLKPDYSQESHH